MSNPLPPAPARFGLRRRLATTASLVMVFLAGAVISLRPAAAEVRRTPTVRLRVPSNNRLPNARSVVLAMIEPHRLALRWTLKAPAILPPRPAGHVRIGPVALFSVTRSFGLNLGYTAILKSVLRTGNWAGPSAGNPPAVKPVRRKEKKTAPGMELLALTGEAVRNFILDALTVGGKLPLKFDECTSAYMTIAPDFYRSADRVIADETFLDPAIYARNISKGYGIGLGVSYRR